MQELLNFLKNKYYTESWPLPKKDSDYSLELIKGDILQFLHKADERRSTLSKTFVIDNLVSEGPINSFEVVFNDSFFHPIVHKISIKPEYSRNNGIDVVNNELQRRLLANINESLIYLTNEALIRLCLEFVLNECKNGEFDTNYCCDIPRCNNLWISGANSMGLSFDHNGIPLISPTSDPYIHDTNILPNYKNIEYSSYGEDLSPYTISLYEIQQKYLKKLLP